MILKDASKLSPRYIPKELPHREKQLEDLLEFYLDQIEKPDTAHLKIYRIVGEIGTGKTVTILRFGQIICEEARKRGIELKYVYLNPKQHGVTRLLLFRHLVRQVDKKIFSTSLSAEELIISLIDYLNKTGKFLIVAFDELDYVLKNSKEPIIYNLTRINEVLPSEKCNVMGIIFTSRSLDYQKFIDDATLSTLGRFYVVFEPYTSDQIFDILEKRVNEAFYPGAISDEVLRFVSDVTTSPSISGDVRYALDLLYYAARLAENRGDDRVMLEHVREVISVTSPSITEEDIIYLSDKEKFILLSIARALKRKKYAPYLTFDEIVEEVEETSKELGVKRVNLREIVNSVHDLETRGIIEIKGLKEIGITRAPVEKLNIFLDNLIKRLSSFEE